MAIVVDEYPDARFMINGDELKTIGRIDRERTRR